MQQFKKKVSILFIVFILSYAGFSETSFIQKAIAGENNYVTTANLNVRTGPSTKYVILGVIQKGERVDVKSAAGTGWYQILYKEKIAYVSSQYVKIMINEQSEEKNYETTANLNVRTGPSTKYAILGVIKKGERVDVVSAAGTGWYQILYKEKKAYVSSQYVKIMINEQSEEKNYASTANLNVRTGPSTKFAILGVIQKGERVDVKSATGTGWYQILYKEKKAYVSGQYVKIMNKEQWKEEVIPVVAKPDDLAVLINKLNKLPENFVPKNLIDSGISFPFTNSTEKQKLRKEAALAIQTLVRDAKEAGYTIVGVSGYRSHKTQVSVFESYVKQDGYEKARMYSAIPGTSEHQTGLAIDVGNSSATCAATSCFQNTQEAKWLQLHVAEYGFIIRYPKGKESITGYQYEPWHLRYVGKVVATEIMKQGITLEEFHKGLLVKQGS
ncbi:SH3 domain-containing protein [Neobacillus sp. NPDC093182]|uniref:SH3 domain-containing protein n=1 Tax=Neobacillus sp. NPDC093182 TaxID=3364297 RepID=UPI0037F6DF58